MPCKYDIISRRLDLACSSEEIAKTTAKTHGPSVLQITRVLFSLGSQANPADKGRFLDANVATKEIGDVCTKASANGHQTEHVIYYLYVNTSSLSFL